MLAKFVEQFGARFAVDIGGSSLPLCLGKFLPGLVERIVNFPIGLDQPLTQFELRVKVGTDSAMIALVHRLAQPAQPLGIVLQNGLGALRGKGIADSSLTLHLAHVYDAPPVLDARAHGAKLSVSEAILVARSTCSCGV